MNSQYELNGFTEENYYAHKRLNKHNKLKVKADVYRYLEESTDTSNPIDSFFSNEDETINRRWRG